MDESGKKEEILSVKDIYTPLSVAKEEIWRRWNDKELRKKVEEFLGGDVPEVLKDEPRSFLVRQITSPDLEFECFLELAKLINLKQLFVEYSNDKFVSSNPDKYYRCNLYFYKGEGKNGGYKVKSRKIIDFDKYDGELIKNIKTIQGYNLLDFHHKLTDNTHPLTTNCILDVSDWIKKNGNTANKYYVKYLAWFICYGVLFENFNGNESERKFTSEIILPAINKLQNMFGLKPLIVPLIPIEDEASTYWRYYPEKAELVFESIFNNDK